MYEKLWLTNIYFYFILLGVIEMDKIGLIMSEDETGLGIRVDI